MSYGLLLALHLLAAIAFAGTVFFEVVMLEGVRKHLPQEAMRAVERAVGNRATAVMPWVLLTLYVAGIGLAWQHRAALLQPLASSFGLLLALKIALALTQASSQAKKQLAYQGLKLPTQNWTGSPVRNPAV